MTYHNVPPFVEITEAEFTQLCELAIGRRILDVQFCETRMRLENNVTNHWVFPMLASWRGLDE